jgi:asparagine synthetase B (glutamine-hydrolysing)
LLRRDCPGGCGSFEIVSTTEILSVTEKSDEAEERQSWIEILPGMVHQTSLIENPSTHNTSYPFISFTSPRPREFEDASISKSKPEEVSKELWDSSTELEFHLRRAVAMRLDQNGPSAVLFSGGLDSAVVAALAAELCTHPLYLYNVSFGPSFMKSADRKAALITAELLQQKYPDKKIIYRDIIVDWEDISKHEPHIRTLLQPKTTLMDVNIGIALWFAGRGKVDTESEDGIACDPNRVLLLGMGADEQMGGYGRHRKAFDRGGWESLGEELEMDQSRFWERNLGRDDRICADHSKEARFPFLDAHVVRFLKKLPLSQICDFSLPPGEGDKRILRLVAARIGLDHASGLVKRAIQFGSRISHLSDAKRFGSRRKAKGQASVNAG